MNQINYSIFNQLLIRPNHIRGLAKAISSNQTSVSRKINELYEENIVDYRKEGKNKVFYIKKNTESRLFTFIVETKKVMDTLNKYPRLRRIIDTIKKDHRIKLAVIFGSYAKGIAKEDSDIDIYIDSKNNLIKQELSMLDSKLSIKLGRYDKSNLLIKEIEKSHIIIKGVERFYEKNKLLE